MAVPAELGGYVFCVRVADHPTPQFRYVRSVDSKGVAEVVDDTLACLDRVRPRDEWDTARDLPPDVYERAFEAWAIARDHVVARWNFLADPANIAPVVPAVMRRASQTVQEHTAAVQIEDLDRAVEALEAPYADRILRLFRLAMSIDDHQQRAKRILELVDELGLEPPPPPDPLPEIRDEDVHLVCWMALVPPADPADFGGGEVDS